MFAHTSPLPNPEAPWATAAAPAPGDGLGGSQDGQDLQDPPYPHRPHRRLRLAMYGAFLAMAVAVALQGAVTWHLEGMRSEESRLLDQAAEQRLLALQLGHQATLLLRDPGNLAQAETQLGALLAASTTQALQLESELGRQLSRSPDAQQRLAKSLGHWQAARERLWYRGENLLRHVANGEAAAPAGVAEALLAESAPTAAAAAALATELHHSAEERAAVLRRGLQVGMAGLLMLLGVLSLAVVEPTARAVRRQAQRRDEQAAQMRTLALVAEHTTAMVMITDAQDHLRWANPAFTQLTGWPVAEVLGKSPAEFLPAAGHDTGARARLRDAVVRGVGFRDVFMNRTRDGHELWLDVDLRPLRDSRGELAGYISVNTDVTQRMAQQGKLQALWSVLPAGVVVTGPDGLVQEANREAEQLLGLSLAQMQRLDPVNPVWRLLREDGSELPPREMAVRRTLNSGVSVRNETVGVRLPDGPLRWLQVNTEALLDAGGDVAGAVVCLNDITDRRRLQDQLHDNARTDALTRLPNRAAVVDRLEQAIAHATRHPGYGFAVLFMDFDRFKQVNDTMGHGAGDELLRQIAARLQRALRPGDQLARLAAPGADAAPKADVAARLGGDEFVVVLEGVNSAGAVAAVADRVLDEVSEPYLIGSTPLQSSASIGVVLHLGTAAPQGPVPTAEEVLRNADTAMYEAKRAGRGRWVMFDNSMHERVVRALAMEADLRRALAGDELFVVYQPVVDLDTRAVRGVEALARWRHPERGLVPPADFIPVAEEAGLIDAVGTVVLRKACAEFVAWQRDLGEHAPQTLAVNLSRAQLKRQGMVQELAALLDECGMRPEWLQLEVTESLAAQDEPVQATLRLLKGLGLKLALDDFGTGYSSLACLHQLPVDTVKVDKSFVQHAERVEYHRVLIEATVRVARTLGMTTVAEGIETEGQAALMQQLNCSRGQGYLFSRPLEAAALRRLLLPEFEPTS